MRKAKIDHLRAQIACNNVLYPRIQAIEAALKSDLDKSRTVYFNSLVEQLEKNPSKDCPPGNDPNKLEHTYDGMLLSLLRQVGDSAKVGVKEAGVAGDQREDKLGDALADGMAMHVAKLKETIDDDTKTMEDEIKEQKKNITSEDLHEGFSNKVLIPRLLKAVFSHYSAVRSSQTIACSPADCRQTRSSEKNRKEDYY